MFKFICLILVVTSCSKPNISKKPNNAGLAPCAKKPNCVSSMDKRTEFKVAPIQFKDAAQARQSLINLLKNTERVEVIHKDKNYIHATFTSLIMRFTDDVEFFLVPQENIIHVRSASRVGHSDFGVNRKRVEYIRKHIEK